MIDKYKISYILKTLFFSYFLIEILMNREINNEIVILFLINVSICIVKERFNSSFYVSLIEFAFITFCVYRYRDFTALYMISIYDFIYEGYYAAIFIVILCSVYFYNNKIDIFFIYIMVGIIAYLLKSIKSKQKEFRNTIDNERRLRYELEKTKAELLKSSMEAVHIAEVKERNRIARNIHDNVGHSIAGIFMQLQVVKKLYGKDDKKVEEILTKSINGLSNALKVLRDTVHNIKPSENIGIEYIEKIIKGFVFCKVKFNYSGDVSLISAVNMEIIVTNIKEALTNVSKYSKAKEVQIRLDLNEKYIRLFIKDNGIGASNLHYGLGLSGMEERVRNVGGNVSISSENGFLIVCIIPISKRGGKIFETFNS